MQAMQRRMTPFTSDRQARLQASLFPRLVMALPPIAELGRPISFGGWRPERIRDRASASSPGTLDIVGLAGLWALMCQVDPHAFAMFGMPVFSGDSPALSREKRLAPVSGPVAARLPATQYRPVSFQRAAKLLETDTI
jgi:hypothetical protein